MHLESTRQAGHWGSPRLGKLGPAEGAGDNNTNGRRSNRHSCCGCGCGCGCGVGSSGGLFPGPSSPRTRASSDGVQGRVKTLGALAGDAVLGLVLGPAQALEVLAVAGGQSDVQRLKMVGSPG